MNDVKTFLGDCIKHKAWHQPSDMKDECCALCILCFHVKKISTAVEMGRGLKDGRILREYHLFF